MDRRTFIAAVTGGLLAAPLAAEAQQTGKIWKIGWLSSGTRSNKRDLQSAFLEGLQQLGHDVGRNVIIEQRDADGRIERLPLLAAELVRISVDVIVTTEGVPATRAAKNATRSIPIVMAEAGDPVQTGLVASLARPGGNVTGLSVGGDLPEKRLQLLREMLPTVSRVAVFYNPAFPATLLWLKGAQATAPALSLTVLPMEARTSEELEKAFAMIIESGGDALLTLGDPFTSNRQSQVLALTAKHRLAAIHMLSEFVNAGGLVSYGINLSALYRRAAVFVDKILKGAKPGDLPVEQPTKYELVINLKTAKALGLTIPPALLQRADQVIE
jgi:putative tryptophan/tyrosine transport system substrate-binding protein